MPRVGNKQFPYTPEGLSQARAEARLTGMPISGETPMVSKLLDEEDTMSPKDTMKRRTLRTNNRMNGKTTNKTPRNRMRY